MFNRVVAITSGDYKNRYPKARGFDVGILLYDNIPVEKLGKTQMDLALGTYSNDVFKGVSVSKGIKQGVGIDAIAEFVTKADKGEEIFDFYDDFDRSSLDDNKWQTNASSVINIANGKIALGGGRNENDYYLSTKEEYKQPIIVESRGRLAGVNKDSDLIIRITQNYNDVTGKKGLSFLYDGERGDSNYGKKGISVGPHIRAVGPKIESSNWQMLKIDYTATDVYFWDDRSSGTLSYSGSFWDDVYVGLAGDTDTSSRKDYIDWIRVRKYISPEPAIILNNNRIIIQNNSSDYIKGAQVKLPINYFVPDLTSAGNHIPFCYEHSDGQCDDNPYDINSVRVKIDLPVRGKTIVRY